MFLRCGCCIIPKDVLERFAQDPTLPAKTRASLESTVAQEPIWRTLRVAQNRAIQARLFTLESAPTLAKVPSVTVNDCQTTTSLPGKPVAKPGSSGDQTAKRAFDRTTAVVDFYKTCFGRNSIDDLGMTLASSIHYDVNYNNAFWNGVHMTYGDGDGQLFLDFTRSNDVIAHELAHGVTEYTSGFVYTNEPGGLNESMSDVFGSMFRQWQKNQIFSKADWLIGADIVGPAAKARGYKCLRDLADPGAKHCISPQPFHYKNYIPGGDPHDNSGIPNHAFYLAAKAIGGRSWEKAGKVWYERFIIERRGGIAGLKGRGEIAADELDQSDRETLKNLFKGGKKLPKDEGADRYTYTVTRQSDSGSKTVEIPETLIPRALTRVVKDQF